MEFVFAVHLLGVKGSRIQNSVPLRNLMMTVPQLAAPFGKGGLVSLEVFGFRALNCKVCFVNRLAICLAP